MDRLRTAWIVVFVAGVAIGRYALPRANAEANAVVTREGRPMEYSTVREIEPPKTQLLAEVVRCATQAAREDARLDKDADGSEDTGDGLTDEQRWESEVAVLEDALPRDRGAIQGQVHDAASGEPLAGVTVVVTAPELDGTQTAITDERGFYAITGLPASEHYLTTFYYLELTVQQEGVVVGARKVTPVFQKLDQSLGRGITITDEYTANVRVGHAFQDGEGITIDHDYTINIPTGRTFGGVLEAAGEPQGEGDIGEGISFSGVTSLENTYYVEGTAIDDPM